MNQLDFWHDDNNLANIKNDLLVLNGLLMVNVSWTQSEELSANQILGQSV